MRNIIIALFVSIVSINAQEKKESWLKNVFKYSTIYGAYSQTNSIQAPQTFIVTQDNNLIETTKKHPADMMVTYGVRKLARVGKATPYKESEQDGKSKKEGKEDITYLVRYMYTAYSGGYQTRQGRSREFCIKMMNANKVYRKEDIIALEKVPVNAGFGVNGAATYSIWLYKGGARCSHRWTRKIYARKDGSKSLGDTISTTKAKSDGFTPESNPNKVSIAPRNMPNKGYTAAYWNKMGFKN